MSKLYSIYKNLKIQDSDTLYLFKSGIFYIFLDADARKISSLLNLKLTNLNNEIVKCGFPVSSSKKYFNLLNCTIPKYKIIDDIDNISLTYNDFTIKESLKELLNKIDKINIDFLSISEAYQFIEDIKKHVEKIKEKENINNF